MLKFIIVVFTRVSLILYTQSQATFPSCLLVLLHLFLQINYHLYTGCNVQRHLNKHIKFTIWFEKNKLFQDKYLQTCLIK